MKKRQLLFVVCTITVSIALLLFVFFLSRIPKENIAGNAVAGNAYNTVDKSHILRLDFKIDKDVFELTDVEYYPLAEKWRKLLTQQYNALENDYYKITLSSRNVMVTAQSPLYTDIIAEDYFEPHNAELTKVKTDHASFFLVVNSLDLTQKFSYIIEAYHEQRKERIMVGKLINITAWIAADEKFTKKNVAQQSEEQQLPEGCAGLVPVIQWHNKLQEKRINLIFSCIGYYGDFETCKQQALGVTDFYGEGTAASEEELISVSGVGKGNQKKFLSTEAKSIVHGLFGEEPLLSNKAKFNIWFLQNDVSLNPLSEEDPATSCNLYCSNNLGESCELPDKYYLTLCNKVCRSIAFFDNNHAYIQTKGLPSSAVMTSVGVHEFGHIFGKLADEYVDKDAPLYNSGRWPNCFSSKEKAQAAWPEWKYAYQKGCNEGKKNYVLTGPTIMTSGDAGLYADFEPINYFKLCMDITFLTGNAACTLDQDIIS